MLLSITENITGRMRLKISFILWNPIALTAFQAVKEGLYRLPISRNIQVRFGHPSIIEEDKSIFFHAWRSGEGNVSWNTVYPIVAKYRLDGNKFIFE